MNTALITPTPPPIKRLKIDFLFLTPNLSFLAGVTTLNVIPNINLNNVQFKINTIIINTILTQKATFSLELQLFQTLRQQSKASQKVKTSL